MNSSVLAVEFKMQWSDAFRCVEMLLSAGGNVDKMTLQAAETSSAADLCYLYHCRVLKARHVSGMFFLHISTLN